MAVMGHAPRRGLARRRKALGFTQESLAHRLRVDRSTVVRWEAGKCEPSAGLWPAVAAALEISPEQLSELLGVCEVGAAAAAPVKSLPSAKLLPESIEVLDTAAVDRTESEKYHGAGAMHRRKLLRLLAIAGASLVSCTDLLEINWDRLQYAARTENLDGTTVDNYAKINRNLWQIFSHATRKEASLPLVLGHFEVLTSGLRNTRDAVLLRRMSGLVGDLLQLAGEISFDANRYTDAAHCYTSAALASKEAQDLDLWACAIVRHSFLSIYEGQFAAALPMLSAASEISRQGNPDLATRYWIRAVEAQALAGVGNLAGFQRAIDSAEGVHGLKGDFNNGGWLRFDGSRIAEERGASELSLSRPESAELALNEAMEGNLSARRRGCVLSDLAMVGVQQRDPERVAFYAAIALEIAHSTDSGVVLGKLRRLQTQLVPLISDGRVAQINSDVEYLSQVSSK